MTNSALNNQAITAAAAGWVIRLGGEPLSPAERAAFDRWRAKDPRHVEAFARAQGTWAELTELRHDPGVLAQDGMVLQIKPGPRHSAFSWAQAAALAASLIIVIGGGAFWLGDPILALTADHRTAPGRIEQVTLTDGSVVDLGPDSAISTHFDGQQRRVSLLAGEAYFTVAPLKGAERRPFVVEAANGTATALGTQFAIDLQDNGAEITVTEHRVGVASTPAGGVGSTVVVAEGQAVRYDRAHGLGQIQDVDPDQAAAWRRGRLVFDRVPLDQVVAALNRYRRGRIVIANSDLADRRVSGVFETTHLDTALSAIAQELGVRTASLPPLVTVLY